MTNNDKYLLPEGTVISEFRLESLIGRGAMAAVYRALQINLDRTVAVKILPAEFANDKDFVERFFNEARAAAALSHSNIVQAYDAGITDNNICYFAMEFVNGENLQDKIDREGPMSTKTALHILLDMAKALAYGWQTQRLKHGDLKPANIMLNERGEAKLADFGLAKIGEGGFEGDGIMLTPLYAAPEMIIGENIKDGCQSDIYSFGATFYHLLTGTPPFPGEDPEAVMDKQVYSHLTPVIECNQKVPLPVSEAVDRLLEKNPERRPQTWEEVINSANKLLRSQIRGLALSANQSPSAQSTVLHEIKARTSTSTKNRDEQEVQPKKTKTKKTRLLIILLLAAIVLGAWLVWSYQEENDSLFQHLNELLSDKNLILNHEPE